MVETLDVPRCEYGGFQRGCRNRAAWKVTNHPGEPVAPVHVCHEHLADSLLDGAAGM